MASGRRRTRYRWTVMAVAVFVWLLVNLDRGSVPGVLPYIRAEFGIDHNAAGLLVSLTMLMNIAGQFSAGIVTDRLGTKSTLRIAVLAIIATAFNGVAGSYHLLVALRALLGFGQSHGWVPTIRAIGQWTAPWERGRGTILLMVGASAGASLAPLLAALTISLTGSWRALFWEVAALGVVLAILLQRFFFDTPQQALARGRLDLAELQHIGSKTLPAEERGIGAMHRLLHDPMLWVHASAAFLNVSIFMGVTVWIVSYLREQQGLDVVTAGLMAAFPTALSILTALLSGWLIDRFGLIRLTICASFAALVPVLYLIAIAPRSLPIIAFLLVLLGVFFGLANAPLHSYQMRRYPLTILGRAAGISGSLSGFGSFVTPLVTGLLVTSQAGAYSYYNVFLYLMLLAALAAIAGLFLSPKPFCASTNE